MALTIVVVAYVAVPPIARFVESLSGYNPRPRPARAPRLDWLGSGTTAAGNVPWDLLVNVGLVLLVVVVWVVVVPWTSSRRPPS